MHVMALIFHNYIGITDPTLLFYHSLYNAKRWRKYLEDSMLSLGFF